MTVRVSVQRASTAPTQAETQADFDYTRAPRPNLAQRFSPTLFNLSLFNLSQISLSRIQTSEKKVVRPVFRNHLLSSSYTRATLPGPGVLKYLIKASIISSRFRETSSCFSKDKPRYTALGTVTSATQTPTRALTTLNSNNASTRVAGWLTAMTQKLKTTQSPAFYSAALKEDEIYGQPVLASVGALPEIKNPATIFGSSPRSGSKTSKKRKSLWSLIMPKSSDPSPPPSPTGSASISTVGSDSISPRNGSSNPRKKMCVSVNWFGGTIELRRQRPKRKAADALSGYNANSIKKQKTTATIELSQIHTLDNTPEDFPATKSEAELEGCELESLSCASTEERSNALCPTQGAHQESPQMGMGNHNPTSPPTSANLDTPQLVEAKPLAGAIYRGILSTVFPGKTNIQKNPPRETLHMDREKGLFARKRDLAKDLLLLNGERTWPDGKKEAGIFRPNNDGIGSTLAHGHLSWPEHLQIPTRQIGELVRKDENGRYELLKQDPTKISTSSS